MRIHQKTTAIYLHCCGLQIDAAPRATPTLGASISTISKNCSIQHNFVSEQPHNTTASPTRPSQPVGQPAAAGIQRRRGRPRFTKTASRRTP